MPRFTTVDLDITRGLLSDACGGIHPSSYATVVRVGANVDGFHVSRRCRPTIVVSIRGTDMFYKDH
jgi:hypothetical protein